MLGYFDGEVVRRERDLAGFQLSVRISYALSLDRQARKQGSNIHVGMTVKGKLMVLALDLGRIDDAHRDHLMRPHCCPVKDRTKSVG